MNNLVYAGQKPNHFHKGTGEGAGLKKYLPRDEVRYTDWVCNELPADASIYRTQQPSDLQSRHWFNRQPYYSQAQVSLSREKKAPMRREQTLAVQPMLAACPGPTYHARPNDEQKLPRAPNTDKIQRRQFDYNNSRDARVPTRRISDSQKRLNALQRASKCKSMSRAEPNHPTPFNFDMHHSLDYVDASPQQSYHQLQQWHMNQGPHFVQNPSHDSYYPHNRSEFLLPSAITVPACATKELTRRAAFEEDAEVEPGEDVGRGYYADPQRIAEWANQAAQTSEPRLPQSTSIPSQISNINTDTNSHGFAQVPIMSGQATQNYLGPNFPGAQPCVVIVAPDIAALCNTLEASFPQNLPLLYSAQPVPPATTEKQPVALFSDVNQPLYDREDLSPVKSLELSRAKVTEIRHSPAANLRASVAGPANVLFASPPGPTVNKPPKTLRALPSVQPAGQGDQVAAKSRLPCRKPRKLNTTEFLDRVQKQAKRESLVLLPTQEDGLRASGPIAEYWRQVQQNVGGKAENNSKPREHTLQRSQTEKSNPRVTFAEADPSEQMDHSILTVAQRAKNWNKTPNPPSRRHSHASVLTMQAPPSGDCEIEDEDEIEVPFQRSSVVERVKLFSGQQQRPLSESANSNTKPRPEFSTDTRPVASIKQKFLAFGQVPPERPQQPQWRPRSIVQHIADGVFRGNKNRRRKTQPVTLEDLARMNQPILDGTESEIFDAISNSCMPDGSELFEIDHDERMSEFSQLS